MGKNQREREREMSYEFQTKAKEIVRVESLDVIVSRIEASFLQ